MTAACIQIDVALADESRVQEKSRCLWEVSPRLNKDNAKGTSDKVYDNEVYDDRQFYSFLVKVLEYFPIFHYLVIDGQLMTSLVFCLVHDWQRRHRPKRHA